MPIASHRASLAWLILTSAAAAQTGPSLLNVFPGCGSANGGTPVTISGSGFLQGPLVVSFGGASLVGLQVIDDFTAVGTTPPGVQGATVVVVSNAGGSQSVPGAFQYEGPAMCLAFDGLNDFATVPDDPALDGFAAFTIEAWFNAIDTVSQQFLVDKFVAFTGLQDDAYTIYIINNRIRFQVYGPSSSSLALNDSLAEVYPNTWNHFALVKSTSSITLYLNGALDRSVAFSGSINSVAAPLLIGKGGGANFHLAGKMDEIRVWNIARTQQQILGSLNRTLPANTPGLVAYWRLDDLGQALTDSGPLGLHGTLGPSVANESSDPNSIVSDVPWNLPCASASVSSYAACCAGPSGVPMISTVSLPIPGQTYQIQVANLAPATLTFMLAGYWMTNINLGSVLGGSVGCFVRATPDVYDLMIGSNMYSLAIPNSSSLLGAAIHNQALQLAFNGSSLGSASVSNAVRMVIGVP